MNGIISLREYISKTSINPSKKTESFCRLMKKVSDTIEKEERNLIRINLDEISINQETGKIVFPEHLFGYDMDKTMAGFNTGISLVADRKSTNEHKKVAFALMMLGWYVNPDRSSIHSDMEVLENFEEYMSKIPGWLREFFINVFRKMDYTTSFSTYYEQNFVEKVKKDIRDSFSNYKLTEEQIKRISTLIIKETTKMLEEGGINA